MGDVKPAVNEYRGYGGVPRVTEKRINDARATLIKAAAALARHDTALARDVRVAADLMHSALRIARDERDDAKASAMGGR